MTKKKTQTALEQTLSDMAVKLARDAQASQNLQDFTSAFKSIVAYYAVLNKVKPPVDEDDGKFGGHAEAIRDTGAGSNRGRKALRPGNGTTDPEW